MSPGHAASRLKSLPGLALVAAVACGGAELTGVGVSRPRAVEHGASADGGVELPVSPLASDFRAHLTRVTDRFVSQGHARRFDAVVWANEAARGEPTTDAGGAFPDGAIFVEEAFARAATDAGATGLLVMEKRAGAWRFATVDADGKVVDDPRQAACALCHREAPRDFAFH